MNETLVLEEVVVRNILENLSAGLLVVNPHGEIVLTNAAASAILGRPVEVIAGKGWAELFMGEGNDEFNQVLVDVIWEKRMNLRRTVSYTRPDREVLRLSVTSSFIRADGKVVGIVVLLNDLTEIHALHMKEKTILQEKHRLQKERTESLANLATAVAHQLRNPTTAIGGFAALMLRKADPDTLEAKYLQNIVGSTRRLEDLVRAVHDYACLPLVSPLKTVVSGLCEPVRQRVRKMAAELSREVDLVLVSDSFEVEIDPVLFVAALEEFLDNAVESLTCGHGRVEVNISGEENMMLVRIQDNGAGIAGKDLPYIFDPFFTTKAVGVGMGLCRARQIIALHGGDLRIESIEGTGTKAFVRIPLAGGCFPASSF